MDFELRKSKNQPNFLRSKNAESPKSAKNRPLQKHHEEPQKARIRKTQNLPSFKKPLNWGQGAKAARDPVRHRIPPKHPPPRNTIKRGVPEGSKKSQNQADFEEFKNTMKVRGRQKNRKQADLWQVKKYHEAAKSRTRAAGRPRKTRKRILRGGKKTASARPKDTMAWRTFPCGW